MSMNRCEQEKDSTLRLSYNESMPIKTDSPLYVAILYIIINTDTTTSTVIINSKVFVGKNPKQVKLYAYKHMKSNEATAQLQSIVSIYHRRKKDVSQHYITARHAPNYDQWINQLSF